MKQLWGCGFALGSEGRYDESHAFVILRAVHHAIRITNTQQPGMKGSASGTWGKTECTLVTTVWSQLHIGSGIHLSLCSRIYGEE